MKIDEWKAKFLELHASMREDLGANLLEVQICDGVETNWPSLSDEIITTFKIIAK